MRESRLFRIVYYLLARGRATAPELAARFEVSTRTIYRDLDALSAAGVPVYALPGKGGGVGLMEGYSLDKALFSKAEQDRLLLALRCLPEEEKAEARDLAEKLEGLFQGGAMDWLEVELSPWGGGTAETERFQWIKAAILQKRVLRFSYVDGTGRESWRRVCPTRLLYKGSAWYMQAFCLERRAYRTFKLSRMAKEALGQEGFGALPPPPKAIAPAPAVPPTLLRFEAASAYRVYDEFNPLLIQREEGGSLLVLAPMPANDWFYGYLLSFGGRVKVVSPRGVREELLHRARALAQAYL